MMMAQDGDDYGLHMNVPRQQQPHPPSDHETGEWHFGGAAERPPHPPPGPPPRFHHHHGAPPPHRAPPPAVRAPPPPPSRRVDHTYREYSNYPAGDLPAQKKGPQNFPSKLHRILSTPDYDHIIGWMPHGRAWKIHNKELLIREVVPKYFVQSKYESFTRQLNGWGFKRLHQAGNDFNAYYHEAFLRGLPRLTVLLKRVPPNQGRLVPHAQGEPNFYEIDRQFPLPAEPVPEATPSYYGHHQPPPYQYPPPPDYGAGYGYGVAAGHRAAHHCPSYPGGYSSQHYYGHRADSGNGADGQAHAPQPSCPPPYPYYPGQYGSSPTDQSYPHYPHPPAEYEKKEEGEHGKKEEGATPPVGAVEEATAAPAKDEYGRSPSGRAYPPHTYNPSESTKRAEERSVGIEEAGEGGSAGPDEDHPEPPNRYPHRPRIASEKGPDRPAPRPRTVSEKTVDGMPHTASSHPEESEGRGAERSPDEGGPSEDVAFEPLGVFSRDSNDPSFAGGLAFGDAASKGSSDLSEKWAL
ncbi:hypothetical protein ACHAWF_004307 [Thalassiosira exigua]